MDVKAAIARFAEVARQEILRDHRPNSCIASTRITIDTFQRLGFTSIPLEVVATVGNGPYSRLRATRGPPASREVLEMWGHSHGALVVGIGQSASPGGIGGHLVAVVDSRYLIDASLGQINAEAPSLQVPSVVAVELHPSELAQGLVRRQDATLYLEYVVRPALGDWRSSPDWLGTPETETAVERIIHILGTPRGESQSSN